MIRNAEILKKVLTDRMSISAKKIFPLFLIKDVTKRHAKRKFFSAIIIRVSFCIIRFYITMERSFNGDLLSNAFY